MLKQSFLRSRQLLRSWRALPLTATEKAQIQQILLPGQADFFWQLPLYEQRHALNVCNTLIGAGYNEDNELLQAALLHDLGKRDPQTGRTIPLWGKVANVALTKIFGRQVITRLAAEQPASWRYVFWLQLTHEKRSAKLAQSAGSSKRVIALVGNCKTLTQTNDPAARALKWADDLN